MYKDPFGLDLADYPKYPPKTQTLKKRITNLLKTLEDNNHLAKLVRFFRSLFWGRHVIRHIDIIRVLPHLKQHLTTVDLDGGVGMMTWRESFNILEVLHVHSSKVRHIKVDVWPESSFRSVNNDQEMIRILGSFLHLQDIDIAIDRDLDAEAPLSVVQTIAKTCPELRFVNWRPRSYLEEGIFNSRGRAFRVYQYTLVNDVWETNRATGIEQGI
ncbi:hypothetical protein FRB93_003143 [Tulasnella sp. JGI-2019a]|nr:hypothetical protein FRB93_003143 [Tulasnella sp. JGI-2019a]